jgi:hypothetical protein
MQLGSLDTDFWQNKFQKKNKQNQLDV